MGPMVIGLWRPIHVLFIYSRINSQKKVANFGEISKAKRKVGKIIEGEMYQNTNNHFYFVNIL